MEILKLMTLHKYVIWRTYAVSPAMGATGLEPVTSRV